MDSAARIESRIEKELLDEALAWSRGIVFRWEPLEDLHGMRQRPVGPKSALAHLLSSRGALVELLLAAVLLAVGVNLLSDAIEAALPTRASIPLWSSLAIIAVSILFFSRKLLASRHIQEQMDGVFALRRDTNTLIRIERYHFSEHLSDYMNSLFAENEAYKALWVEEPLTSMFSFDPKTHTARHKPAAAGKLIQEALEYYVLERLSTHLTDYFNRPTFDATQLKELGREDVPDVLFRNRFLDAFSRPMIERAAFVQDALQSEKGRVIMASSRKGARYARFDLVLPKHTKVRRLSDGHVEIVTPKFTMKVQAKVPGINATLPRQFQSLYLGVDFRDCSVYAANVLVSVTFRRSALLTPTGWKYHMWLDSFLRSLREDLHADAFFDRIGWETALTVSQIASKVPSARGDGEKGGAE